MVARLHWSKPIRMPKSIRIQLMLGFGAILLLSCISSAIGYVSLQRLRSSSQTTLENAAQVRELSLELKTNFLLARQAEEAYLHNWRVASFSQNAHIDITTNQVYLAQARANLAALKTLDDQNPDLANELALLDSLFDNYESAFQATTSRIARNGSGYQLDQHFQTMLNSLETSQVTTEHPEIQLLLWEIVAREQAYFNTGDPQYVNDVRSRLDRLTRILKQIQTYPAGERINTLSQDYITNLNAILLLDQQVQVNTIISENINQEINRIIQAIGDISQNQATQARLDLAQTANQSSMALLATAIIALALTVWASVVLGRRIIDPLTELTETAEGIAQGNLDQSLELSGDNEFTIVAAAFNKMVTQLRQTLVNLEQRVEERTQALAATNQSLQDQTQSLEVTLQKLRHSQENYRDLIDHLHAGVVVHAPDTTILLSNQMACDLLGRSLEDIVGQQAIEPTWDLMDETELILPPAQYPVNQVIVSQQPIQNRVVGIRHPSQANCTWTLVNAFPAFDQAQQLAQVVVTFIDITDLKLAEAQLRHQALHDALTGLPNRTLFTERLNHAIQDSKRHPHHLFAVLFIDLDRFKVINDSLGHLIGDQLLIQAGQILSQHVRGSDTVARLGGDEFVILLEQIASLNEAIRVVKRIQVDLQQPVTLMGHTVFTSASIGIAFSSPAYTSAEDMLRDADNAMYRAKSQGKSCYEIFNPEMHQRAVQLLQLETSLRQAVEQQSFTLYYQPVVSLENQQLLGFEALVRWIHPERGLIAPGEFIPLAEETGLIIPLSDWIFQTACGQMADWCHRLPAARSLKMNVNVAAGQFQTPNFFDQIDAILAYTNLAPTNLKLEVTESLLLENIEAVLSTLFKLQQRGIEISIDDFGTGYSSLSYLKRFPINTLKIDKSFVDSLDYDQEDASIVQAIIQISHSLGMTVVAEGVETPRQRQRLAQLGCGAIQGYLIAPPLPAAEAEALIEQAAS